MPPLKNPYHPVQIYYMIYCTNFVRPFTQPELPQLILHFLFHFLSDFNFANTQRSEFALIWKVRLYKRGSGWADLIRIVYVKPLRIHVALVTIWVLRAIRRVWRISNIVMVGRGAKKSIRGVCRTPESTFWPRSCIKGILQNIAAIGLDSILKWGGFPSIRKVLLLPSICGGLSL